jgi:hypothetical protein
VAKVGTSNPDRTISLKRLQCVVENNKRHKEINYSAEGSVTGRSVLVCVAHVGVTQPTHTLSHTVNIHSSNDPTPRAYHIIVL